MTQVGTPFGTASYMSPEQAKGERADARSDLFSLGIVMYEMLTGRLPFRGKSSVDVMHSVMHDEPPPLGEGYPPKLQQIVSKVLAKDREARYQSADLLLEDLRALVRSHYAQQGVIPTDKTASMHGVEAARKRRNLLDRMAIWVQRTFNTGPLQPASAAKEDSTSAGSASVTPGHNAFDVAVARQEGHRDTAVQESLGQPGGRFLRLQPGRQRDHRACAAPRPRRPPVVLHSPVPEQGR